MKRMLCALSMLLMVVGWDITAHGETPSTTNHTGGPPELVVCQALDQQSISMSTYIERVVTRQRTTTPPAGGKPTTTVEAVATWVKQETRMELNQVFARRLDGRKVSSDALLKELAQPKAVILTRTGNDFNPLFAPLFKPETLVLSFADLERNTSRQTTGSPDLDRPVPVSSTQESKPEEPRPATPRAKSRNRK